MKSKLRRTNDLKNLFFSTLVAVMFAVGFAVSAGNTAATADRAADVASAVKADQPQHSPPASVDVDAVPMVREMAVPAVRTSVGKSILNARAFALQPEKELDGYPSLTLRPKIKTELSNTSLRLGYSGLGGNHFARADV